MVLTDIDSSHVVSKPTINLKQHLFNFLWSGVGVKLVSYCCSIILWQPIYFIIFTRIIHFLLPLQVILTANLPFTETLGGVILTSMDAGVTFRSVQLPFHPAQAIQFHYHDPKYLVVISIEVSKVSPPVSLSPLNSFWGDSGLYNPPIVFVLILSFFFYLSL